MSTKKSEATEIVASVDFAKTLADAIAASQPKQKVTFGEYLRRKPKRPALAVEIRQNGARLSEQQLLDEQIELINKLKPGTFLNGRVTVEARPAKLKDGKPIVLISYPCSSIEARMDNGRFFRDFSDLLRQLTSEQPATESK